MKKIFILLGAVLMQLSVFSANNIQKANTLYEEKNYAEAAKIYEGMLKTAKSGKPVGFDVPAAYVQLGHCYNFLNQNRKAVEAYKNGMDKGYKKSDALLGSAKVYMKTGQYAKALSFYQQVVANEPDNKDAVIGAAAAEFSMNNTIGVDDSIFKPENLNSEYNETAVGFYEGTIVITSSRAKKKLFGGCKEGKNQFYFSSPQYNAETGTLGEIPPVLPFIRSTGTIKDLQFAYDKKGNYCYIAQHRSSKTNPYAKTCNIYQYKILSARNGKLSKPQNLSFHNDSYNIYAPTLSSDGQVMIFVMDKGQGPDLYISKHITEAKWSDPKPLGIIINTDRIESTPFIANDSILFFSAERNSGMGGLDVYYSHILGQNGKPLKLNKDVNLDAVDFSQPTNLKAPINSGGDDYGFVTSNNTMSGFWISNRGGDVSTNSVYAFNKTPEAMYPIQPNAVPNAYRAIPKAQPLPEPKTIIVHDTVYIQRVVEKYVDRSPYENLKSEADTLGGKSSSSEPVLAAPSTMTTPVLIEDTTTDEEIATSVAKPSNDVEYRVQIAAAKGPLDVYSLFPELFKKMPDLKIEEAKGSDGYYRYHTPDMGSFKAADALRNDVKKIIGNHCFVSTYKNSKRVSINIK